MSDGIVSKAEHQQPVESQGDSGTRRQSALHRGQQMNWLRDVLLASTRIVTDASPQRGGVREFVIAVAEFDAVDVQLEALCDGGLAFASNASQRGLRAGIVEDERRPTVAEMRFDSLGQQEIQPAVAIARQQAFGSADSQSSCQCHNLVSRPCEDFRTSMTLERLVVGQAFKGLRAEG